MRALCTKRSTTTRFNLTTFTFGLALLLATVSFTPNSATHAEEGSSSGDGVTFLGFIGGPTYTIADQWLLEGWITAGDPTAVTIQIGGAANGSATVEPDGYFQAVLLGREGTVYAIATYQGVTVETQTELVSGS